MLPALITDCSLSVFPSQWEIYDSYVDDLAKQERNKEKQKAPPTKKEDDKSKKKITSIETQVLQPDSLPTAYCAISLAPASILHNGVNCTLEE